MLHAKINVEYTPWTVAHQTLLSTEFHRQEYWSRLPFPTPRDLPNPGIKPVSLVSPVLAIRFFTTSNTWEAQSDDKPHQTLNSIYVCLVAQSCLTLSNPLDCSPPGSSVHGIFSGKSTGNEGVIQGRERYQHGEHLLVC